MNFSQLHALRYTVVPFLKRTASTDPKATNYRAVTVLGSISMRFPSIRGAVPEYYRQDDILNSAKRAVSWITRDVQKDYNGHTAESRSSERSTTVQRNARPEAEECPGTNSNNSAAGYRKRAPIKSNLHAIRRPLAGKRTSLKGRLFGRFDLRITAFRLTRTTDGKAIHLTFDPLPTTGWGKLPSLFNCIAKDIFRHKFLEYRGWFSS